MNKISIACVAVLLAGCGKQAPPVAIARPEPPNFVASGNAPTPHVAAEFLLKYVAVAQAAIDRTPYKATDSAEQMRLAQEMYKADGEHLSRWREAGISLFTAAGDQTCKLYVAAIFNAWNTAYPLNGPPVDAELEKKRQVAAQAKEYERNCTDHMKLASWGTGAK
ncbi:hypothetical protein [Burkholderia cepacia]|uniref:hypothetical protein n=1 Tax=Burkholderia cepacia TaxID=292 RepID=UPI00264A8735|nr:hypothetical protein [Burkholderia cepacia]MDN7916180.1 hypothetical protein [Burkholderia cepacia]